MTEEEMKEFRIWQRSRQQTALEQAFGELEDLYLDMRGYNITMPTQAFKTVVKALMLLKKEIVNHD